MITKNDIANLIAENKLFQIEVDDRHMAVINEVFLLGMYAGINSAKKAIDWRINGEMWSKFIDEGVEDAVTETS